MTIITFKEMTAKELKENTINYEELSPLGKTILDGSDYVVFNGQFIDVYKGNTRIYQFGFSHYSEEEYFGNNGIEYVSNGYELIG